MQTENSAILHEIESFLQGYSELKYLVNVETAYYTNKATCVIHEPNKEPHLKLVEYTPFLYLMDLEKHGIELFGGDAEHRRQSEFNHGITIKNLITGKNPRLENGFILKISSSKSYNDITNFLKEGGVDMWAKYELVDYSKLSDPSVRLPVKLPIWYTREFHAGIVKLLKYKDANKKKKKRLEAIRILSNEWEKQNNKGFLKSSIKWSESLCDHLLKLINKEYIFKHLFYSIKTDEQFFISTGSRLFKGIENYNELHKVTFDIETTGLKFQSCRIFQIGIKDNRTYEDILEVKKDNDDEEEKKVIFNFFNIINHLKPAVIAGYNSEDFDFAFILGRAAELGMNLDIVRTTLSKAMFADRETNIQKFRYKIKRKENSSVKFGNSSEKYTATLMWGYTVLDILHAVKRTAAVNSDIKNNKLKYICKFEKIAKANRMYVDGDVIHQTWKENLVHIINPVNNEYEALPEHMQKIGYLLYDLQEKKDKIEESLYKSIRIDILSNCSNSDLEWFKAKREKFGAYKLTIGSKIVRRYLLDDLWETEKVDELYNQSSFLLAKIVPTTYSRICTMGNAAVWNLIMTTWSYENDLAIPAPDAADKFSGGLARCYRKGYAEKITKVDYNAMYPRIQLTFDIFPLFDITGVIKKILMYLTETRDKFKILASDDSPLPEEERNSYKVKQLPIKILNNSLFGALGSGKAFNWSDLLCAARITCIGRIYLRQAITWFMKYGLNPILAVTDGINFSHPSTANFDIDLKPFPDNISKPIEEAWVYVLNGKTYTGIKALSKKFSNEELPAPFMGVDMDGMWKSSLTLSRINYANLTYEGVDKKTGKITPPKIKLTGNTIKSKTMSEYIEDFIDLGLRKILNGKGEEFVEDYNEYLKKIYFKQIPLKKIATKKKYKKTISQYLNRGKNKNGHEKGKQAHMELVIQERNQAIKREYVKLFGVDNKSTERYKEIEGRLAVIKKIKRKLQTQEINDEVISLYKERTSILNEMLENVSHLIPLEPELDSYLYYVNVGTKKGHGDSTLIEDEDGNMILASKIISAKDLEINPEMLGDYNVAKYVENFNKRAKTIMEGFAEKIIKEILIKDPAKREYLDSKDLVLQSFPNDDYDESLVLEEMELRFWNRTGFDPSIVWKGFKLPSDNALENLTEYQEKIKWLNNKFIESGSNKVVKSVNDKLEKGNYVLVKNFMNYDLYAFNGTHVEWVKKLFEEDNSMKEYDYLTVGLSKNTMNIKDGYVVKFKELFKISPEVKLSTIPNGLEMFEEYYAVELAESKKKKKQTDAENDEALDDLKFLDDLAGAGADIERD